VLILEIVEVLLQIADRELLVSILVFQFLESLVVGKLESV
jgi:hypothetical protein